MIDESAATSTARSRVLQVLITIDTEFWTDRFATDRAAVDHAVRRDLYGETPDGERGVRHQLRTYERHGVKAVFLVEALHASACGDEPLRRLVGEIQGAGHEVQLHVHAEWVQACRSGNWPPFRGLSLPSYSEAEQRLILERSLGNLHRAGAEKVLAFRGGNYGADNATLRVLSTLGVPFDTSHNAPYLGSSCRIETGEPLRQPRRVEGVVEVPITNFEDFPGHRRHAQLSACSAAEMRAALGQAWARGWRYFVIVTHSNELLNARRDGASAVVTRRLDDLCRFLAANRDKFRTVGFRDIDPSHTFDDRPVPALTTGLWRTVARWGEQLGQRIGA